MSKWPRVKSNSDIHSRCRRHHLRIELIDHLEVFKMIKNHTEIINFKGYQNGNGWTNYDIFIL